MDLGLPRVFSKNRLAEMLGHRYPDKKWGSMYIKYSQQKVLERALHTLFKVPLRDYRCVHNDLTP